MHVEAKLSPRKGSDGYWHRVQRHYTIPTLRGELRLEHEWYPGRNYNEFAILANVRNGRGFAGIKTGEGFNPIADPKGLPKDVSDDVASDSRAYGSDGHSHSWLTLKELIATPEYWDQKTVFEGEAKEYAYRECAVYILTRLIPAIEDVRSDWAIRMSHQGGDLTLDDVRIVFWFDN